MRDSLNGIFSLLAWCGRCLARWESCWAAATVSVPCTTPRDPHDIDILKYMGLAVYVSIGQQEKLWTARSMYRSIREICRKFKRAACCRKIKQTTWSFQNDPTDTLHIYPNAQIWYCFLCLPSLLSLMGRRHCILSLGCPLLRSTHLRPEFRLKPKRRCRGVCGACHVTMSARSSRIISLP